MGNRAPFEKSARNGSVKLAIATVRETDAGRFVCVARNAAGSAESSALLVVKSAVLAPRFVRALEPVRAAEGDCVRLQVRVAAKPPAKGTSSSTRKLHLQCVPTSTFTRVLVHAHTQRTICCVVSWFKNGQPLSSSSDVQLAQEGELHSLTIPEVFDEDAGQYAAVAENPAGQAVSKCELTVQPTADTLPTPAAEGARTAELRPQLERPFAPTRAAPPSQAATAQLKPAEAPAPYARPPAFATAEPRAAPQATAAAPTNERLPRSVSRPSAEPANVGDSRRPPPTATPAAPQQEPRALPAALPPEKAKPSKPLEGSPPTFTRARH